MNHETAIPGEIANVVEITGASHKLQLWPVPGQFGTDVVACTNFDPLEIAEPDAEDEENMLETQADMVAEVEVFTEVDAIVRRQRGREAKRSVSEGETVVGESGSFITVDGAKIGRISPLCGSTCIPTHSGLSSA